MDHAAARIIDANLNRAREALRVMEEYARFHLDDRSLTAAIKEVRHELAQVGSDFEAGRAVEDRSDSAPAEAHGSLIAHRDIVGDVGRAVTTPHEHVRSDVSQVALAAGKRLSEALRAIEEYGKTIDPSLAARVEQLRYQGYELERRLHLTARARERFGWTRLYVLITELLCQDDWFATAEAALDGGADCLQLREKDLPDRELLERAKRLAGLCREHDALFIVNDRPDIAVLSGADGVHLGQDDITVSQARRIMPSTAIIGVSTHTLEQFDEAVVQAPDYVALGPMFPTATKPQDHVAGPEMLAEASSRTSLPLVAIGGINDANAGQVLSQARCCLCVCSAVIAQADVAAAAARLCAVLDRGAGPVAPDARLSNDSPV